MIEKIKIKLWKLGLLPTDKCPRCGNDWLEHGYGEFGESGRYWCENCGLFKGEDE